MKMSFLPLFQFYTRLLTSEHPKNLVHSRGAKWSDVKMCFSDPQNEKNEHKVKRKLYT